MERANSAWQNNQLCIMLWWFHATLSQLLITTGLGELSKVETQKKAMELSEIIGFDFYSANAYGCISKSILWFITRDQ